MIEADRGVEYQCKRDEPIGDVQLTGAERSQGKSDRCDDCGREDAFEQKSVEVAADEPAHQRVGFKEPFGTQQHDGTKPVDKIQQINERQLAVQPAAPVGCVQKTTSSIVFGKVGIL